MAIKLKSGLRIDDKVAIITGSSRGMGRAAALLFGQAGANVVVNYNRDSEAADKVVNAIKDMGSSAVAVKADVGRLQDHQKLIDAAINEFGKIDILYHNAGFHHHTKSVQEITEEIWDYGYDHIVKGPFFLTQKTVPYLQKQKGSSILFTSSSSTGVVAPVDAQYFTAKGAINIMVRLLSGAYAPDIRVNCVVPGFIGTDAFRHHPRENWDKMGGSTPLGRMGKPIEVARAALFLVSDEAEYITGESVTVDGGRQASLSKAGFSWVIDKMFEGTSLDDKDKFGDYLEDMDVGL